jgi:large subunit ribosomal protein L18Ae
MTNMYKEYRDVSLNGAVSQLHQDMAGNHRASKDTISIIRTSVLHKKEDVRRANSRIFRDSKLKFPILRSVSRASHKRFRTIFKANRPNTFKQ